MDQIYITLLKDAGFLGVIILLLLTRIEPRLDRLIDGIDQLTAKVQQCPYSTTSKHPE